MAKIAPAPPQTHQSNGRKHDTPLWKQIAEWSVAGATVGLLIINIFLWKATKKSADAAKSAADTARDTFRLTYRPRLKILGITPMQIMVDGKLRTELDKGRLRVSIDVPNTGPFPARNVRFFRYDDVSTRDKVARHPYGQELLGEPKLIPPKSDGGWNSAMIITGEKVLTPSELAGLKDGTLYAIFSVLVTYDDDFGEAHHAEFCGLFTLQPYSDICPWTVRND